MRAASFAGKFLIALWLWAGLAQAWAVDAVVIALTGTVSAQRPDGKVRLLTKDSGLMAGEIVLTEKGSSAKIRFGDDSTVSLRPATRLVIENFNYEEARPEADNLVLNLVKGGMRAVSGAVGKRGDRDAYRAKTASGTIGIRGTDYALLLCDAQDEICEGLSPPSEFGGGLPEGLYLTVFDGAVDLSNQAGSLLFTEGQSGYARDDRTPPVPLATDPGLIREFPTPGAAKPFGSSRGGCMVR